MDVLLDIVDGRCDVVLEHGDLKADHGLRTAMLVSIFSDGLAAADDVPAGEDRRGWWAQRDQEVWGSKLWLLERSKQTPDTLDRARQYVSDAVAWIPGFGLARKVDVTTKFIRDGQLGITVVVEGGGGRWNIDNSTYDGTLIGFASLRILRA